MTAPLCFIDTETTGVHPGRRPWEIAIIRRDETGDRELLLQIADIDLADADPFGLKIGGFYERHLTYRRDTYDGPFPIPEPLATEILSRPVDPTRLVAERVAAEMVEEWTRGAHVVGVVPSFDAETLDGMLRRHRLIPAWHYHLVDVEAMAVGWLHAFAKFPPRWVTGVATGANQEALPPISERGSIVTMPSDLKVEYRQLDLSLITPPWKSDELSRACGVEPPVDEERHTALGDARWAQRWYDALIGTEVPA